MTHQAVTRHSQKVIESMDEMLKASGDLEAMDPSERHHMATHFLLGLETVLRTLAKAMPRASFTYRSPLDTGEPQPCPAPALGPVPHPESPITASVSSELSLMIQEHGDGNVTMGQTHAQMLLNWAVATEPSNSGNSREPKGTPVGEGRGSWDVLGLRF